MAVYNYEVIQKTGKKKKGSVEAENIDRVYDALRMEGNIIVSVKEQSVLNKDITLPGFDKIKPKDLAIFCRQFRSILTAGITVVEALDLLYQETEKANLKKAIKNVQSAVEKGETLAGAMQLQGNVFPPILINMMEAGEASGSLEIALDRMATQFDKDSKLRSLIAKAMIYPIVVCVVAIVVVAIMMVKVIPNFKTMFENMDQELPVMTQAVMGISDFVMEKWYIILIGIGALATLTVLFRSSDAGKLFFAKLGVKLPLFGKLTIKSSCARFARTMSTLMAAGISMLNALEITSRTIKNKVIKEVFVNTKEEVSKGVPLSEPLMKSEYIPPRLCHMTKIGEDTGNLEAMLDNLAEYYEEEVENTTSTLTSIMEPMIIIVLAAIVGIILIAIMSPMLSIYSNIENA